MRVYNKFGLEHFCIKTDKFGELRREMQNVYVWMCSEDRTNQDGKIVNKSHFLFMKLFVIRWAPSESI